MAKPSVITPGLCRQLLRYEPETGKFFWRARAPAMFNDGVRSAEHSCRVWNVRFAQTEAFTSNNGKGHRKSLFWGRKYYAHRVAWAVHYGEWPKGEIDHINGDPTDNRIVNLREVSHQENGMNTKRRADNSSGITGVGWHAARSKWAAQMHTNGRHLHLGLFANFDDAVAARKAAEVEYGFHANHGRG